MGPCPPDCSVERPAVFQNIGAASSIAIMLLKQGAPPSPAPAPTHGQPRHGHSPAAAANPRSQPWAVPPRPSRPTRKAHDGEAGGNQHDAPAPPLQHARQRRLDGVDGAQVVDAHLVLKHRGALLQEQACVELQVRGSGHCLGDACQCKQGGLRGVHRWPRPRAVWPAMRQGHGQGLQRAGQRRRRAAPTATSLCTASFQALA